MQPSVGLVSGCSLVGLQGMVATSCPHPSVCPQEFANDTHENKSSSSSNFLLKQPGFGGLTILQMHSLREQA